MEPSLKPQYRLFFLNVAATAFDPTAIMAQPKKPTKAELDDAIEIYRKMGGTYLPKAGGFPANETIPVFIMKRDSRDEDIKSLPNLKFPFMLHFNSGLMTNASIKELKAFPNLVALDASG